MAPFRTVLVGLLLTCLLLNLLSVCCSASQNSERSSILAEASFVKQGEEGLFVTLHLRSGKQLLAMIDTGSPDTILDESLNAELGKPLGFTTVTYPAIKKAPAAIYRTELYLGNVQLLTFGRVLTASRGGMAILGMDCLSHYCIQLDFASGKLRLLEPERLHTEDLGQPVAISISRSSGYVTLNERFIAVKSVKWLLDTGGCGVDGLLNPRLFQMTLQNQHLSPAPMKLNGVATRGAIVPRVTFGSEQYTNLVFGEVRRDIWQKAPNVLALRFLQRHLVTLNFPKRVMYLRHEEMQPPFKSEN